MSTPLTPLHFTERILVHQSLTVSTETWVGID